MAAVRYWRVTFTTDGKPYTVREIAGPGNDDWVVVLAPDEEAASKKATRLYCARKKKLAKSRLHATGRCACGRAQDRVHPNGRPMLTCSTCSERQKTYHETYAVRSRAGTVGMHQRDEPARVEKNLARQRDRRSEIRLETLLECRRAWESAPSVGRYKAWLLAEIEKCTKGQAAA
jgi:hypothetical protein